MGGGIGGGVIRINKLNKFKLIWNKQFLMN